MTRIWQALLPPLLWLMVSTPAMAGETITPRQRQLFQEFMALQPEGYDGPGPWMLDVWDTDSGLTELIALPTHPGNAAANFQRLEEFYPSEQGQLQTGGEDSRGVLQLLDAAEMAECRLTPEYYPAFDQTTAKQPDFVVLRLYLTALQRRGERAMQNGDVREAERCYRAMLVCGWHLTRDRTSYLVYLTGVIFKYQGAQYMEMFLRRAGRSGQAEVARRYAALVGEVLRLMTWKLKTGISETAGFANLPCLVRIATGDREPCWRKAAVEQLAILRHGAPDVENRRLMRNLRFEQTAEEALSLVVANDPDPGVRRLALWATLNLRPDEGMEHVFE